MFFEFCFFKHLNTQTLIMDLIIKCNFQCVPVTIKLVQKHVKMGDSANLDKTDYGQEQKILACVVFTKAL